MPPRAKGVKAKKGVTMDQFAVWMHRGRHAVYEWKSRGGLVLFDDGSVDPISSCRQVDAMLAGNAAARKNNPENALTEGDLATLPAALMVDESLRSLPPGKLAHLVAMYRAEEARIELEKGKRTLIETIEAADIVGRALQPAIYALKALPYQIGPTLVGIDDERKVIIGLEQAVNDVLRDISSIDPVGLLNPASVSGATDPDGR